MRATFKIYFELYTDINKIHQLPKDVAYFN